MLVLSNKLLVLMAASTTKTSTFTASDLVEQTVSTFQVWADKDLFDERVLRSTIYTMKREGLLMDVGEQESVQEAGKPRARPRIIMCFTDRGRALRIEASQRISRVMVELNRIVEADILSLSNPKKPRRTKAELASHVH